MDDFNDARFPFAAKGQVRYFTANETQKWVVIDCPADIAFYYNRVCRWLLHTNRISLPLHGSHITVIAGKHTHVDTERYAWEYNNKKVVDFRYGPIQDNKEGYFWLPVICLDAIEIRTFYGLSPTPKFNYHLTIGNNQHENSL